MDWIAHVTEALNSTRDRQFQRVRGAKVSLPVQSRGRCRFELIERMEAPKQVCPPSWGRCRACDRWGASATRGLRTVHSPCSVPHSPPPAASTRHPPPRVGRGIARAGVERRKMSRMRQMGASATRGLRTVHSPCSVPHSPPPAASTRHPPHESVFCFRVKPLSDGFAVWVDRRRRVM